MLARLARAAAGFGVSSWLFVLAAGCGHLVYADGPYHGRVLEAETKRPIDGAAVLAVWWKRSPGLGHPIITVYDAQETLTDQDGNFTIPGIAGGSLNPLATIEEPLFTIFKPGYEAYGDRKLAAPGEERRTVVELRALTTRDERLRNLRLLMHARACMSDEPPPASCIPREKFPNLTRLKHVEERNLGLR
jgi:hypothetical protein